MAATSIRHPADEHYTTIFNRSTGFFARVEDVGYGEPFWSKHGPELLDISVTDWCDRLCTTCYRASTKTGLHMSVSDYRRILCQAASCGVLQVALGGGNPNQHPYFPELLRIAWEEYGIVPNYTTNGRGLDSRVLAATKRYCGAAAISYYHPIREFEAGLHKLCDSGSTVNVHFVLNSDSIREACAWFDAPPRFLQHVNAVIFLNYKPVGRGAAESLLLRNSAAWDAFIDLALSHRGMFRVGFDSCMVSGLARAKGADPLWLESCEAARFSMYVSEQLLAYPCSFMEGQLPGTRVTAGNLLQIWRYAPTFRLARERLRFPSCGGCSCLSSCRGGCPVFKQINLCDSRAA